MPISYVEKDYRFRGPDGEIRLIDLFARYQQLILYRFFYEPGVAYWPRGGCRGCSMFADSVTHPAHLAARDVSLAFVSPHCKSASLPIAGGWAGYFPGIRLSARSSHSTSEFRSGRGSMFFCARMERFTELIF